METLAAGGRYDAMIDHHRKIFQTDSFASTKKISQSAVGISIFLDKVVQLIEKGQSKARKFADVLVCLEEKWVSQPVATVCI